MDSHCVVCGNYVPEGRTVCPQCEKGETMDKWTLQEEAFKRGYEKGKADAEYEMLQEKIKKLEEENKRLYQKTLEWEMRAEDGK